jgi:hypothetical protein
MIIEQVNDILFSFWAQQHFEQSRNIASTATDRWGPVGTVNLVLQVARYKEQKSSDLSSTNMKRWERVA